MIASIVTAGGVFGCCGPLLFVLVLVLFSLLILGPLALTVGVPDWLIWLPVLLAAAATVLVALVGGFGAILDAKEKALVRRAEVKRAKRELGGPQQERRRGSPNPDGERLREELRRERDARKHNRDSGAVIHSCPGKGRHTPDDHRDGYARLPDRTA